MIFVDTSFFFAVFSDRDRWHVQALECLNGLKNRGRPSDLFLTTNHVIFETIALARSKAGHALAVTAGEELLSGQLARIHHASPEEERAAFEYLKKHDDKEYSAVDCLSFVLMLKTRHHRGARLRRGLRPPLRRAAGAEEPVDPPSTEQISVLDSKISGPQVVQ